MQRRSATVYVALFLVVAAGAYALIGTAQQPEIDVGGEAYTEGDELTVNDREYAVDSVGDGEGTLSWTNESARQTEMWSNNTTVELADNSTFRVFIPNESDPDDVTLREEFELDDDLTTVTENETTFVVVGEGEDRDLVPVDQYRQEQFGEPETREFSEGDTFDYRGNETTVNNVTTQSVELVWTAPQTNAVEIAAGEQVDLGPEGDTQTFVPVFEERGGDQVVVLSPDVQEYENQVEAQDDFSDRISGLWAVIALCLVTVALLIMLGFLPNK